MLQQTRVEAVRNKFSAFIRRFPTLRALAAADVDDVLQTWSGLGYYRRARMLHAAAREMVATHNGRFPRDHAALLKLPGIGRYTAGAICSIAFNQPQPIVDGNVERVFARLFAIAEPIKQASTQAQVWRLAEEWANAGQPPRVLNQALMELGATVCTPRNPRCDACPVATICEARKAGDVRSFPAMPRRGKPKDIRYFAVCVSDDDGRVLLIRRNEASRESLLPAGLWELPHVEWRGKRPPLAALRRILGTPIKTNGQSATRKHTIMDYKLAMHVKRATIQCQVDPPQAEARWFTPKQAMQAAQSAATNKLLEALNPVKAKPSCT